MDLDAAHRWKNIGSRVEAGVGLINMKITDRNGLIVDVESVNPGDEIMMLTNSGMIIRYSADDVRIASRQSIGVA